MYNKPEIIFNEIKVEDVILASALDNTGDIIINTGGSGIEIGGNAAETNINVFEY